MKLKDLLEQHGNGPISLGKSYKFGLWDVYDKLAFIQRRDDFPARTKNNWGGTLHFNVKPTANKLIFGPGLYAWSHPDFGDFYIGISSVNSEARWVTHVRKLIDHCGPKTKSINPFPKKWQQFVQEFVDRGYQIEDLDNIQIRFWPIPNPSTSDFLSKEDIAKFKRDLEAIEKRIVKFFNPYCNHASKKYEFDTTKWKDSDGKVKFRSSTRFPEPRKK